MRSSRLRSVSHPSAHRRLARRPLPRSRRWLPTAEAFSRMPQGSTGAETAPAARAFVPRDDRDHSWQYWNARSLHVAAAAVTAAATTSIDRSRAPGADVNRAAAVSTAAIVAVPPIHDANTSPVRSIHAIVIAEERSRIDSADARSRITAENGRT